MVGDIQGSHHFLGDFDALLIDLGYPMGYHPQTRLGGGLAQILQNGLISTQRTAGPGPADLAEKAMLNGVPLATTRRIMTNRYFQTEAIRDLFLQLLLEEFPARAIAAPTVGVQQQTGRSGKAGGHLVFAPVRPIVHRELGGVGGLAYLDGAQVVGQIIEAIRDGFARSLTGKVRDVAPLGLLTPDTPRVFEVAD